MNTKLTALIALGITVAALACPWLLRLPYATVDETEQLLPLPDVSDMPPGWDAATSDPSGPPLMAKLPPIPVPPAGAPRLAAPNGETETALRLARLEAAQAAGIGAPSEPRGRASPPIAALPSGAISPLEEMINHLIGTTPAAARPYDLEIFALDPGTTNSYRIRADVEQIPLRVSPSPAGFPPPGSGAAYHLPAAGRFYLQWSDVSASARRYYGPFEGDPRLVLGLPAE